LIEGNRTATSEVKEILFASANMLEKLASGKANDTTFKTLLATYETLLSSTPSPSKEEPESAPERVEDESEELDTGLLPEHVEDTEPVDSLADFSDLFDEETDTEPVDSLADFSDLFDEEMATSELFDEPIPLPEFEIDTIPTSIDSIDEEMIQSESSETNTGMFEEPEFVEQSEDCATKQDHDDEIETVDPELAEIFAAEAEDHLRIISTLLPAWDKEPTRKELLQQIRRSVHTLKGAAGMVGFQTITELAHRMEDLLDQLYDEMRSVNPDIMALLFASADTLDDLAGGTVNAETLQALYANYAEILDSTTIVQELIAPKTKPVVEETVSTQKTPPVVSEEKHRDTIDIVPLTSDEVEPETNGKATPMPMQSSEVMRVPLERLDELIRLVSELAITRTTFEQRMGNMVHEVEELRASLERLRQVSFDLETKYEVKALGSGLSTLQSMQFVEGPRPIVAHGFDDLEFDRYTEFHRLSRELAETTSDINTVGNELGTLIGEFDGILTRQRRLSTEIQEKLMRTRMVPLATLATRLNRTVRVVSRKQGKLVDLVLEGENVELDKTVLDEMADPLLHLLRNSVDHGIELPEMRRTISKPEHGTIHLRSYHQGNQVVIQISDDGAGLNPQKLRAAIVKKGYVSEADALKLSDDELYSFIFTPGFSTAGKVSEISGRGVGMDIVRTNVLKLKGSISVDSQPGQGITFTIRLPMTLAVTRSLMVRAHNEMFAIPSDAVMQILRLEEDEFEVVGQELVVRVGENVYPTVRLGEVLHLKQSVDETIERWPVLILNAGTQQVALIVEQIIGGREIVIKNLGNHLRKVHGITGATLMGDGSVVLILNPAELAMKPPRPKLRERKDMLREIRRSIYRLKESTGMVGIETVPQFATYLEELFNQLYSGKQLTDMDIIEVWEDINTPEKESPVQRNGTLNIMVVDDSVSVRRVVSNLVKNSGWEPVTAKDGLEALEIIQHTSRLPDLMLLDVEMPRMDGYELTATLRADKMYKDLPIVMVTSRAGEKHRRKALEVGANEYVVKPYQDDILVSIIRNLTA
jgi:chemotaxis protein histidine kinase CheA